MAGLKELGKDIWNNKPLLYALLVIAAIGAYIVYKRTQSQSATDTTGMTTNAAPGASGTYVNEDFSYYAPSTITTTAAATLPTPPVATQPSAQPTPAGAPTTGLLGPKVKIVKQNGVYTYKLPGSNRISFLSSVLPHDSTVRAGSNGRWWYIQNGLKFLITSGNGPPITDNGTDANKYSSVYLQGK